jgi:hypothetical protein
MKKCVVGLLSKVDARTRRDGQWSPGVWENAVRSSGGVTEAKAPDERA